MIHFLALMFFRTMVLSFAIFLISAGITGVFANASACLIPGLFLAVLFEFA